MLLMKRGRKIEHGVEQGRNSVQNKQQIVHPSPPLFRMPYERRRDSRPETIGWQTKGYSYSGGKKAVFHGNELANKEDV
jgi:hypothetical protein